MSLTAKITRLVLILVSVIWVIIVGYREYKLSEKKLYPYPTPTTTSTITPTPDFAKDWKTYTDPNNLFSIKYPPEFTLSEYKEDKYSGFQLIFIGPTQVASGRTQSSLFDGAVIKGLIINEEEATALTLAQTMRARENNTPEGDTRPSLSPIKQVAVGNTVGQQYTSEGMGKAQITFVQLDENNVIRFLINYAGTPETEPKYLDRVKQIFSTLKTK